MSDDQAQKIQAVLDSIERDLRTRPSWTRAWDLAVKSLVPAVLLLIAWGIGLQVRVSQLEITTMTKEMGHELENRLLSVLPPQWLREDLAEIKTLLRSQDARLDKLEARVLTISGGK